VVIIPTLVELRLLLILGVDVVGVEVDGTKVGLMLEEQASNEVRKIKVNKSLGRSEPGCGSGHCHLADTIIKIVRDVHVI
jgi:hypothetical protein